MTPTHIGGKFPMRVRLAAILTALMLFVAVVHNAAAEQVTAEIGLNLRTGPSTNYAVITVMPYGATVTVLSWSGEWAQVSYGGTTGWAYGPWLASGSQQASTAGGYGGGYSWITGGYYSGSVVDAIYYWAGQYGVSGDWLYNVANCESGLDPNAVSFRLNPASGTHDIGLFQFQESTFYAYGGANIWDPWDQSRVAAYMFSIGQSWQWVCQ